MNELPTEQELVDEGVFLEHRNSLRIAEHIYKYQNEVYSVFYAIGNDQIPPMVELNTTYKEN